MMSIQSQNPGNSRVFLFLTVFSNLHLMFGIIDRVQDFVLKLTYLRPWPGSSVGSSVFLICQGCRFDP